MAKTSVGRVAHLIPVFETLQEECELFAQAERHFSTLPRALKDQLEAKRGDGLLGDMLVCLLFVDPEERRVRATRLATMVEALRQQIELDRADPNDVDGPMFHSEDLSLVAEFLNVLSLTQGTRNRREMLRFFDAVRSGDVAYLILKNEPKHPKAPIESRFAHHVTVDTADALRLTPAETTDS